MSLALSEGAKSHRNLRMTCENFVGNLVRRIVVEMTVGLLLSSALPGTLRARERGPRSVLFSTELVAPFVFPPFLFYVERKRGKTKRARSAAEKKASERGGANDPSAGSAGETNRPAACCQMDVSSRTGAVD